MRKLWFGTSGFQYKEWKGSFYPEDLPVAKMLSYYAARLPSTEINYTFRHLPSMKSLTSWAAATPEEFRFTMKAPQKVTHFARLKHCEESVRFFYETVSRLGDKLGAVLFQLPPNFRADVSLLSDFLLLLPAGMKAAFEFRHASWFDDAIYEVLRRHRAALCIAEDEDLATPAVATAGFGYLRLRRQDYESADLERWAALVAAQQANWAETFVYFKHEESGLGPQLAQQMAALLAG